MWGITMKKILLFVLVLILPIQATAYLYDDFSDGYLDPELWEEVVADNSTNHIEYHFENQEENAYHTEKISILEAIGVEGHGRTLNKLWGYGQNGKWGWKIQTNTQFKLKKIIKSEAGDPSFAYIYSADRTQLAKTAFNGREALFDYQLEADTVYYIVADRLGGSYTRSYVDTDVNFPYVSPSFNIIKTAEINTGDERTDQIINIESLEIDSPTMYNRKGTRLSLTQPLQPGDKLEYEFALNSADGDHQSHLVFNNLTLFRRMHEIDNFTCGGFAGCGFFGEWNGANLW
ncbi:hypothetical protein CMO92_02190, partial [Candidatus Woesearchaeota archaeon]|nr:hypothetical protein [Candidatus Woesearchaeota archaeon]